MLQRAIEPNIKSYLSNKSRKILFIWGPRRSGKTTLLKLFSKSLKTRIFNFDVIADREHFIPDRRQLKKIAQEHTVLLIDEIQNYPESTLALKILHDEFQVKIIATGSSELRQTSQNFDSLSGRFTQLYCLPLTTQEVVSAESPPAYAEASRYLSVAERSQIFGMYPEVFLALGKDEDKIELLQILFDTYVLKDIIDIYNLRNTKLARDILTQIALQLGSEVSIREIASNLQANVATVSSYIEIFIKNYILIPVTSFKTNQRRAVSQHRKLFFYDLGLRNVLVRDFRPLDLRPDNGGVWENFVVAEVEKRRRILGAKFTLNFYREYGGKEVDLVLEDYYKQYICLEMKRSASQLNQVFPLPHQLYAVTPDSYQEVLQRVFTDAKKLG